MGRAMSESTLTASRSRSHLGTGTEDYYGYAWGMADYFCSPSQSMPRRDIMDRNNWREYTDHLTNAAA